MSWLWGDKKSQEKTKLDFTAKNRRRDLVNRTIKVHLELQMEYPEKMDIIQGIRDTKTSFDLPIMFLKAVVPILLVTNSNKPSDAPIPVAYKFCFNVISLPSSYTASLEASAAAPATIEGIPT